MSVGALQATGVLNTMGQFLNDKIHNVYIINVVIGALSSVVDNVPLVAVAMGMYPVADPATPPTWKVRRVNWVPGSPMDCAAMIPTASPFWAI